MSSTFEPKAPSPGWARRWTEQASELILRSALPLVGVAVAFNTVCFGCLLLLGMTGLATPAMWFPIVMTRVMAILHLLVVIQVVMRADGHRVEQSVLSLEGLRLVVPVALLECTLMIVNMLAQGTFERSGAPTSPVSGDIAYQIVVLVGWLHGSNMASVLSTTCILGVFWPALMVSFGMSLPHYYGNVYQVMLARMPSICIGLIGIGVVYTMMISRLPFWLVQIGSMFGAAWTYVGAREIFGGISENGKVEAKVVAAPAPAAG